jgi:hypothetical protein
MYYCGTSGDFLFWALVFVYKILWTERGKSLIHWKKIVFLPSISFYLLQSHTWPGNARHLCAPTASLSHIFDSTGYLHGVLHKEQHTSGTPPVKPHHTTGDLVLAGE